MDEQYTNQTIELVAPDGSIYEHDIGVVWRMTAKAIPARIRYDENDHPAEPAEWEILKIE